MPEDFDLFDGDTAVVDPMSSVVVNESVTGQPSYDWLVTKSYNCVGVPGQKYADPTPFGDVVSYKIKYLHNIPEHDDTNPEPATVGDLQCSTSPTTCSGRGPFVIDGTRYYIDFRFLYLKNTGDTTYHTPQYTLTSSGEINGDDYGIILACPFVFINTEITVAQSILTSVPKYTNDWGALNDSIQYRFGVAIPGANTNYEAPITVQNVLNAIRYGQLYGRLMVKTPGNGGTGVTVSPGDTTILLLVRYISENAGTQYSDITLTYEPDPNF